MRGKPISLAFLILLRSPNSANDPSVTAGASRGRSSSPCCRACGGLGFELFALPSSSLRFIRSRHERYCRIDVLPETGANG